MTPVMSLGHFKAALLSAIKQIALFPGLAHAIVSITAGWLILMRFSAA